MGVGVLMNLIDIASWQADINLDTVFAQNPLDGLIVKATEGTGYVNYPYCDKWVQWCRQHGKPWGFYHFLSGGNAVAEAEYFVKHCENYFGDGLPCADWEGTVVSNYGTSYLRTWLDTVYQMTGIKPLVYVNLGTVQSDMNGFRPIAEAGYPLWLAQWIGNITNFTEHPPQSGSYAPFPKITVHQYSSTGKLNGYGGRLDLDIFYGSVDDWNALVGKGDAPTPVPDPSQDNISKAMELLLEAITLLKEAQHG